MPDVTLAQAQSIVTAALAEGRRLVALFLGRSAAAANGRPSPVRDFRHLRSPKPGGAPLPFKALSPYGSFKNPFRQLSRWSTMATFESSSDLYVQRLMAGVFTPGGAVTDSSASRARAMERP